MIASLRGRGEMPVRIILAHPIEDLNREEKWQWEYLVIDLTRNEADLVLEVDIVFAFERDLLPKSEEVLHWFFDNIHTQDWFPLLFTPLLVAQTEKKDRVIDFVCGNFPIWQVFGYPDPPPTLCNYFLSIQQEGITYIGRDNFFATIEKQVLEVVNSRYTWIFY